jgi:hypothetical protein
MLRDLRGPSPLLRRALLLLLSAGLHARLLHGSGREDTAQLLGLFGALFALYAALCWRLPAERELPFWLWGAMLLRGIAWFSMPQLSDDYFRFVWDGRLLAGGENPFLRTPEQWMADPRAAGLGLTPELFAGLNSPAYFTIYPPVLQGIFWLGAEVFPSSVEGHVWLMKSFVIGAEGLSLWLLPRLLRRLGREPGLALLYALNPLAIVELSGNLHFEALMLAFLLLAAYALAEGRRHASALAFALAVCSKLLPLMLLPLLLRRIGWRQTFIYSMLSGGLTLLLFWPLLSGEAFGHLLSSVGLYFQKFEFNGGLYSLLRWAGYQLRGYNMIAAIGRWTALATLLGILLFALLERRPRRQNWLPQMLWPWLIYLGLSSIVHPWYVAPMLAFCLPGPYRFPLLWSALLPLTYLTYASRPWSEHPEVVALEYCLLAGWLMWELFVVRKKGAAQRRLSEA